MIKALIKHTRENASVISHFNPNAIPIQFLMSSKVMSFIFLEVKYVERLIFFAAPALEPARVAYSMFSKTKII